MRDLRLLPVPRRMTRREGACSLARGVALAGADSSAARQLAAEIAHATGAPADRLPPGRTSPALPIRLTIKSTLPAQGYTLAIRPRSIEVTGADGPGLYYGVQTLRQIICQCGTRLPCLHISDRPDFPVRGFYHDVARGKVPTRETLFALVEKMAHYKLNQLQLYVEHTFAFRNHPDVWAGADPLTPDDILRLDEHCRLHQVDLVPSLSTFGHFCTFLKSPRLQHLNELPVDASRLPFSWVERLGHYTLDCSNPNSIALVEELVAEYAPLFSSRLFNICCDETFDLGRGRNAAKAARYGKGRLYLGFVKKIMRAVRRQGKTPMLWGDIILHHPELVPSLPRKVVVLNWDYTPDLLRGGSDLFAASGRPFYVCPGVHAWLGWLPQLDIARENILAQARAGLKYGAEGLLNTDWGDCGHVNFLSSSYFGLVLGASAGWNVGAHRGDGPAALDRRIGSLEFGESSGRLVRRLRRMGNSQVVDWKTMARWLETSCAPGDFTAATPLLDLTPTQLGRLETAYSRMGREREALEVDLAAAAPRDPLAAPEIRLGAEGADLMLAATLALFRSRGHRCRKATRPVPSAAEVADGLRRFEGRVSTVWHERNRPSEYFRIRLAVLELARRLDTAEKTRQESDYD